MSIFSILIRPDTRFYKGKKVLKVIIFSGLKISSNAEISISLG
jgi:hypothetical protein